MPEPSVAPDSNATILYTSGSTAHPKGVLATHRSIIHAVMGWECGAAIAVELNPELAEESPEFPPAMILTVPLFHVSGLERAVHVVVPSRVASSSACTNGTRKNRCG